MIEDLEQGSAVVRAAVKEIRLLAVGVAGRAQCEGAGYQKRPVQGAQSKVHM